MNKVIKKISQLQEVKNFINETNGNMLFRGQSNCSWNVNSSWARKGGINIESLLYMAKEKANFMRKEKPELTNFDIYSELQHHRTKTPLIDFTSDINVALWMACSEPETFNNDGAIFSVSISELNASKDLNFTNNEKKFFGTSNLIKRAEAQKSFFILEGNPLLSEESDGFSKIVIDKKIKHKVLSFLRQKGITSKTIYPDIHGLSMDWRMSHPQDLAAEGKAIMWENSNEAIKKFDQALLIDPKFADSYNDKGISLLRLGNYKKAINEFDMAISIEPSFSKAHLNKGVSLFQMGDRKNAILEFNKAIEINSEHKAAYIAKGVYFIPNQPEEAIKQFEKAIEIDPKCPVAYNNKGKALECLGKYEEAVEQYEKAIEIDPKFPDPRNNKSKALGHLGEYEKAVE